MGHRLIPTIPYCFKAAFDGGHSMQVSLQNHQLQLATTAGQHVEFGGAKSSPCPCHEAPPNAHTPIEVLQDMRLPC